MELIKHLLFNIALADQYLASISTSKIFLSLFTMYGLASENLSRAVEDTATVTSPWIPWNSCGATQAKALHMRRLDDLLYSFFNLLSSIFSIAYHFLGIKMARRGLPA
jgi:NhaC family Na+:H+ antiporter